MTFTSIVWEDLVCLFVILLQFGQQQLTDVSLCRCYVVGMKMNNNDNDNDYDNDNDNGQDGEVL